ncbi:hypothetical protein NE237_012369 [Protea cynaroides]|uniref:Glycoside hydrolase family 19 catalytic domain-containing protein n=1 Tax=Protea cynaroides TaxID=273540 RepID=A0A9Q0GYZ5_9MAGN|nr:hypothetical protein NE237_012369 [Protea cynaroides]
MAQTCGCASGLYCSQYEYCGTGMIYYSGTIDNGVVVSDIVTQAFWDRIINQVASRFFGTIGTSDDSKCEIAAFFAHVEEKNKSNNYCDASYTQYPCIAGKFYYGRGLLQPTWHYNYRAAGNNIGFDGLNSPKTMANDVLISFEAALWFLMNDCHSIITSGQGFGATIQKINSGECNSGSTTEMQDCVQNYENYCTQFNVSLGNNLTC